MRAMHRLENAFADLNSQGVLTYHNHCCCSGCGGGDIYRKYTADPRPDVIGAVFYHEQDAEAALDGHGLTLRYGSLPNDADVAAKRGVGEKVMEALRAHGLEPAWDGNPRTAIELETFDVELREIPEGEEVEPARFVRPERRVRLLTGRPCMHRASCSEARFALRREVTATGAHRIVVSIAGQRARTSLTLSIVRDDEPERVDMNIAEMKTADMNFDNQLPAEQLGTGMPITHDGAPALVAAIIHDEIRRQVILQVVDVDGATEVLYPPYGTQVNVGAMLQYGVKRPNQDFVTPTHLKHGYRALPMTRDWIAGHGGELMVRYAVPSETDLSGGRGVTEFSPLA